MIKNRKGFMLVEVVIASTVVLTALVFFYSQFDKIYMKYNERNNYHDLDGLYATKEIINYFLINNNFDFNKYVSYLFYYGHYGYIIKNNNVDLSICSSSLDGQLIAECTSHESEVGASSDTNIDVISTVMNMYNIKNMVITEYDKCFLDKSLCVNSGSNNSFLDTTPSLKEAVENQTFKDYIDYVIGYYNIEDANVNSNDNVYNYIVLTEVESSDGKVYYSNVRLR